MMSLSMRSDWWLIRSSPHAASSLPWSQLDRNQSHDLVRLSVKHFLNDFWKSAGFRFNCSREGNSQAFETAPF